MDIVEPSDSLPIFGLLGGAQETGSHCLRVFLVGWWWHDAKSELRSLAVERNVRAKPPAIFKAIRVQPSMSYNTEYSVVYDIARGI